MTFEKALELLKQGKKVRKCSWGKYYYIVFDEDSLLRQKQHGCDYYNKYYVLNKNDIDAVWEEYKESLLTEEEKEFLKRIHNADSRELVGIMISRNWNKKRLLFVFMPEEYFILDNIKDELFKNLEEGKYYTLKELGLED